jgi:hypothetical protein
MKLFLRQHTGAAPQSSGTVLFHIFDASGVLCGQAEQLSGLLNDGFQVLCRLPDRNTSVRVSSARLPGGGKLYIVSPGIRPRARLSAFRDRLRIEVDGLPCALLGTPVTGEYTVTNARGEVLFAQQRCPGADRRNVFLLSIPDRDRTDIYLGLAVCLNRFMASPLEKFAPAPVR